MSVKLNKMKEQLENYVTQRANHQQIFHQICGAIAVLEELIANFVEPEPEKETEENGKINNQEKK